MTNTNSSDKNTKIAVLKDGAIAGTLMLALVVVYAIDPKKSPEIVDDPQGPKVIETPVPDSLPVARLRLGVTSADFDDMGKLLDHLGDGYSHDEIRLEQLLDPAMYKRFDIIFLTCGGVPEDWLLREKVAESRGRGTYQPRPEVKEKLVQNLQNFVGGGGTLYASDWHFTLLAWAFENYVDEAKAIPGEKQEITADVTDAGLAEILGKTIRLRFDQPGWKPAAFHGSNMTTYLKGSYKSLTGGGTETAPLLVKYPYRDGTVIFTSFHNEKQNSETETQLLKYLVFATVTAQTESRIAKTMVQGGFSPSSTNLLSASAESPSVTRTWECKKSTTAQFVLGFENQGATLKLKVVSPSGKATEKQGTSTFQIDVPEAEIGKWKYTVTAVKVPYANFPFTLTIGEK